jgi:hypothetical protein
MTPLPHQVDACSLLCHEEAKHLHVLTVEVWTGDLERMAAKRKRLHSIPVGWGTFSGDSSLHPLDRVRHQPARMPAGPGSE